MLGLKSPVGILKIHPTHALAHWHTPMHTYTKRGTPTHTRAHPTATHNPSWPELNK